MNKKNLLKTLDMASYVSLVLGAILVLVFEFTASLLVLKFSMILFAGSFLIMVTLISFKLYLLKNEVKENDELLIDVNNEKKPWLIARLVIFACLFVLMLVFLCLY